MNDSSYDDFDNDGIQRGHLTIVECDCDEAIGMAITNGLSISIESDVWEKSQVICTIPSNDKIEGAITLPDVDIVDKNIFLETQGDGVQSQGIPIQVPRDNDDSFGAFFASSSENRPVFNVDIPVDSLREYDEMTSKDKAQLLLSLESFKGQLPQPRCFTGGN